MSEPMIFAFAFNALWQSALFGASVLLLIRFLKINSASARALLWSAAFFLSATLPLTALTLRTDVPTHVTAPHVDAQQPGASPAAGMLGGLLIIAWAAGASWRGVMLVRDNLRITRLRRESAALPAVAAVELPRHVSLRTHADIAVPVVTGFFRPTIILPQAVAEDLAAPAARSAIAHELAHIRRGDLFASLFEALALVFFWWNPILLKIRNAVVENREMACDDRAVPAVADAGVYARSLVGYAERTLELRDHGKNRVTLAAVGKPSCFKRRIVRLMSENYADLARPSVARLALAVAVVAAVCAGAAAAAPRIMIDAGPLGSRVAFNQPEAASDAERLGRLLVAAISEGDRAGADALIAAGADVNAVLYGDGTALIAAVNAGLTEYAQKMIDLGADVDATAPRDETALISAVRQEDSAMVRLLIAAGADVKKAVTTERGERRSPLSEARRLGPETIEQMLREAGAAD